MRVIQTANRAVTIWFIGETAPPLSKTMALIRGSLRCAGFEPWPRMEAESFTAGNETLIIARPGKSPLS